MDEAVSILRLLFGEFDRLSTYPVAHLPISGQSRELAFQIWDDRALLVLRRFCHP
jgi:hypothetical protein